MDGLYIIKDPETTWLAVLFFSRGFAKGGHPPKKSVNCNFPKRRGVAGIWNPGPHFLLIIKKPDLISGFFCWGRILIKRSARFYTKGF